MSKLLLAITVLCLLIPHAPADPLVRASLIADKKAVPAGGTVRIAVHFAIADHWHIYWKNAGASGMPTSVKLTLPDGWTASDWRWPMPKAHDVPGVGPSYIYEKETALIADVHVPKDAAAGEHRLKARARWLCCDESCVSGEADTEIMIRTAEAPEKSADLAAIDRFEALVPEIGSDEAGPKMTAAFTGTDAMKRTLTLTFTSKNALDPKAPIVVAPEPHAIFECGESTTAVIDPHVFTFTAEVSALKAGPDWPAARMTFAIAFTETVTGDAKGSRAERRAIVRETVSAVPASAPAK